MKKIITMAGLIFSFWILMSLPTFAEVLGDARLSLIQGDVAIQTKDTGSEWGAASINTPLTPGTELWVPENGKAEVQFLGGSYLRAAENTDVNFTDLKMNSEDSIMQVGVPQGRTYIHYAGPNAKNSVFQVDTQGASTRAYGPSKFKVDVYDNGYTEVSVLNGTVYVETQDGSIKVDAGSMLSIGADQNAELSPMRQADSWDRWNQSRDSALARAGVSTGYLPPTLGVYSSDLDTYGRWVSTPDYGYVWTPFNVAVDWSPYRIGRWCWIGGDYVWVSYEPWGWAPYHYGRWSFIASVGWCWVPPPRRAVYWSPGFVAWVHTPTYVAWVPLAPGEIYYGYGYYGPHSVDVRNINVNRINISNVYVNARAVNAVTVMNRQTFLTGRPERVVNAPRNPFTAGVKPSIGRPDIKPVRATALPNPLKVISQKQLPSREIVTRAAKIKDRPVATHKDISVFKPGERAPSMHVNNLDRPKPVTSVKKPELGQPQMQRGQGGPSGPSTHREFGVAPPSKGQSAAPPARKEQMNKPPSPSTGTPQIQRPQSVTPKREQMNTPPAQRRDLGPSSVQKGQTGGPSTQREFGVAPPHTGGSNAPPVQKGGSGGGSSSSPHGRKEQR